MSDCPHCRHPLRESLNECPECGFTAAPVEQGFSKGKSPHQPFVPVAKFANVAEAGYFHCELEGHLEREVRLTTQNHFDAPSASWWSNYVLSVPATEAERAAAFLQQLVAETDQAEFIGYGDEPVTPAGHADNELPMSESRIHWTPIILTLTAGTFVIWAAKQVHRHVVREPAGRGANQVDIWDQLSRDGSPWVQHADDGHGRRELLIDRANKVATLREDTDGDGTIDRQSRISLTPAGQ